MKTDKSKSERANLDAWLRRIAVKQAQWEKRIKVMETFAKKRPAKEALKE